MDLCVSGLHPWVDVSTPPEAQSGQGWAALPSRKGISHPQPLHQHWENCSVHDSDCKEFGCDTGGPAARHCQHHCNNPLLQINSSQHPNDMSIPRLESEADSVPGLSYLILLPPVSGLSAFMCHLSSAAHPECSIPVSRQPVQLLLNKITTFCSPGSTMLERAPHWHQDTRNSTPLSSQTENSPVQTTPWPMN